jgi:hypothetical protein
MERIVPSTELYYRSPASPPKPVTTSNTNTFQHLATLCRHTYGHFRLEKTPAHSRASEAPDSGSNAKLRKALLTQRGRFERGDDAVLTICLVGTSPQ